MPKIKTKEIYGLNYNSLCSLLLYNYIRNIFPKVKSIVFEKFNLVKTLGDILVFVKIIFYENYGVWRKRKAKKKKGKNKRQI